MRGLYSRKILLLTIVSFCVFVLKTQAAEVSENLTQVYKSSAARFYSYNYPSKNAEGEDVVLSSMLIAWSPSKPSNTDSIESLHIYSHYTITANKECPTASENTQDRMLFGFLVKDSYGIDRTCNFVSHSVVIAPDYQGYGASRNLDHPYLSQELTAQQVMDGVKYGLQLYQKLIDDNQALPFKSDWRTFAYGFSQGGAVTLAVHRYIEQNDLAEELRFRGSICGDGPYDLIATLRYYLEDDGTSYGVTTVHRKGLCTLPMVLPMIIKGMLDTHPDMKDHTLQECFSQQFLDTGIMDWLASKNLSTGDISKKWYQQLQNGLDANGRHYSKEQMAELFYSSGEGQVWGRLEKMLSPSLYEYLLNADNDDIPAESGDICRDLHRALADNGVAAGWEPQHRIQFVHSRGDMVVPYANYQAFRDAHPVSEGDLYRIYESVTPSDHTAAGTTFFMQLTMMSGYGKYFKWLDEPLDMTGVFAMDNKLQRIVPDAVYDLSGRKWSASKGKLPRGIYIYNGKKILINN